jgi:hypothetical protein
MRETQNSRHVTTAHLGRRFAHLAIECRGFFNDKDTRFGTFALQHERGCGAGKRAADDHDVVIEIHPSKRMAFLPLQSKSASGADAPDFERSHDTSDYFD